MYGPGVVHDRRGPARQSAVRARRVCVGADQLQELKDEAGAILEGGAY
jgi:hypothetical protein